MFEAFVYIEWAGVLERDLRQIKYTRCFNISPSAVCNSLRFFNE